MTDLLLVILINFFCIIYDITISCSSEKRRTEKNLALPFAAFSFMVCVKYVLFDSDSHKRSSKLI